MDFQELGLSKNESAVYETMLRLGKTSASHISKEASVTYGRIYEILGSLEEKGLVKIIPEKTKQFMPADPNNLKELIKAKQEKLVKLNEEVEKLKEVYNNHEKEVVEIVKGKRNFFKILKNLKKAESYQYGIKYNFSTLPEAFKIVNQALKKGVDYKVVGRFDEETKNEIKEWKKIVKEIKPIENDGVAMSIVDDEELMIVMVKSNTIMTIKDEATVKMMKILFEAYYNKKWL